MPDLRPEAAEAVGTAFIVLAGGLAILSGSGGLAVALAFGGTVLVLVYALGHVSGAHFNPAITLAFAATRHFPWRRVPSYVAAQLLGALAASAALLALGPVGPVVAAGRLDGLPAFGVEAAASFLLALVIIAVATDRRAAAGASGLAIGGAVAVGALAAGPWTGAALNPARALGPALVAWRLDGLAVSVLAPMAGAVAAMACYGALARGRVPKPEGPLGAEGSSDLGGKA